MEWVTKPWGWYESLATGPRYQVKRIRVWPACKLSLQSHIHREERWTVVRGTANATVGTEITMLTEGCSIFIGKMQRHRLENRGKIDLELIEIQMGDYLGEDDIIRYEDDYGRASSSTRAPA